jgi:hypothetical protein
LEIQDEKMTILPVDHHSGHKVGPIVFKLVRILLSVRTCHMEEVRLKSEIQNGRQRTFFGSFFTVKMTRLPIHRHDSCRMSPIVFILSEHVAMYDNMPYG